MQHYTGFKVQLLGITFLLAALVLTLQEDVTRS